MSAPTEEQKQKQRQINEIVSRRIAATVSTGMGIIIGLCFAIIAGGASLGLAARLYYWIAP